LFRRHPSALAAAVTGAEGVAFYDCRICQVGDSVPSPAKARYDEKDAMEPPTLNFRTATPADSARIIAIINAAYAIETFLEGDRIDEERLAPMMQKGSILVAENSSGHLLGTVYTELRGSRGYMGMLAVDPAHQGSGLARRLVNAAEDHFRSLGCDAIDIIVLNLRPDLPPLYRRFGFVETGTQPFTPTRALKPGFECHGIVMSKPL
jgi:ribosomal protein S18 acetylase RimI-like enzyme